MADLVDRLIDFILNLVEIKAGVTVFHGLHSSVE
jgi:hypothetical protein